ncbi:hypothetical protein ACFL0V_05540 [Nanoarchaeota archaeon]
MSGRKRSRAEILLSTQTRLKNIRVDRDPDNLFGRIPLELILQAGNSTIQEVGKNAGYSRVYLSKIIRGETDGSDKAQTAFLQALGRPDLITPEAQEKFLEETAKVAGYDDYATMCIAEQRETATRTTKRNEDLRKQRREKNTERPLNIASGTVLTYLVRREAVQKKDVAAILGFDSSRMKTYVQGQVIPPYATAKRLYRALGEPDLEPTLESLTEFDLIESEIIGYPSLREYLDNGPNRMARRLGHTDFEKAVEAARK